MDDLENRIAKELEAKLFEALMGGPATALRLRGRSFEVVELDDDGKIIEPVRCTCGCWAVLHRPGCPFARGA